MPQSATNLELDSFLRALVMGYAKVGKAQPLDEPVLTPNGWRTIGELRVGDLVTGSSGAPVRVIGVYPQGRKKIVRVCTSSGTWTRCSEDHLWFTTTKRELTRGRWHYTPGAHNEREAVNTRTWGAGSVKTAREIRASLDDTYDGIHFLPELTAPVQFEKAAPLKYDPYFVGLLISDGSYTRKLGGVRFTAKDPELLQAVQDGARALGDEGVLYEAGERCPYVRIRGVRTRTLLQELGLYDQRSECKTAPSDILRADAQSRFEFLRGLMDTDGYAVVRGNAKGQASQAEFSSVSKSLAETVVAIVRSLGGRAKIKCKETVCQTGRGLPAYIVLFTLPTGCPFKLQRKASVWGIARQRDWRLRITSIEDAGEAECVCIKVDATDSLYTTRDCILTHNSTSIISSLVALAGFGYVICPGDKSGMTPASRLTKKFAFDIVRDEIDMGACIQEARDGVKKGTYSWVFVDDFSLYASILETLMREDSAKQNKSGKPDGRTWSPAFKNSLLNTVRRLFDLKCHVVVATHFIEQSGEIEDKETGNKQRAKSGVGIVPMIYGSAREELPALFNDVLFMEKDGDRRVFQVNPTGVWGPGSRSADGTHTIDASFVEFMKLVKSTTAPAPKGKR